MIPDEPRRVKIDLWNFADENFFIFSQKWDELGGIKLFWNFTIIKLQLLQQL